MTRWLLLTPLAALAAAALAVPPTTPQDKKPADGAEAEQAAKLAQVEGGLPVAVWAAEPLLVNPVAFTFAANGDCYVVETNRYGGGVPDTRSHMNWLDDDIGSRSVADRLAMYKRHKYEGFEENEDRLKVLWDAASAGKATDSKVFSGGYNQLQDGLAAGVLARNGDVYFACIPDLYRLRDGKGERSATEKTSLATGFGVRAQFIGHDLHGLVVGPDGKLYFSIGDRGLNVTTKEGKHLFNPDSGAVLRCELDGSGMEIVHTGLRNPQDLAFDETGNLFTWDNNSDSGDRARWLPIVEGGDSGWRCGYQYGTLMHHAGVQEGNRGPWNTEKIWHVPGPDGAPPAYVVPPIAHFGNGPSGLASYPGVGLGDRYKGHFFGCDFTANASNSRICSLAVVPKGASYEITDLHDFVKGCVPTDCGFGPDGAFYWSDWVGGWGLPGKGRLFRVADAEARKNPAVAEARQLLADGFAKRKPNALAALLEHAHADVRREAHLELAARGVEGVAALRDVALNGTVLTQRLHAVWGIGVAGRKDPAMLHGLEALLHDTNAEVRAQAARVMGQSPDAMPKLVAALEAETDARVRSFLLTAYGKAAAGAGASALAPVWAQLATPDGSEPYFRHAAVVALAAIAPAGDELVKSAVEAKAARLPLVLALRRLRSPELAAFLADADPAVAAEVARAVYDDDPVVSAMPPLAALAARGALPDAVAYRALAANLWLGTPDAARALAEFAARSAEPEHQRVAALKLLEEFTTPPRRDPITGLRYERPARPAGVAVGAVRPVIARLLGGSDAIRGEAVRVVRKLNVPDVGNLLLAIVKDAGHPGPTRIDALEALGELKAVELAAALEAAAASAPPKLRAAARVVSAKRDPAKAAVELPELLTHMDASLAERQAALAALAALPESKEVDETLLSWLEQLLVNKVPAGLQLDVLEAARARAAFAGKLHAPLAAKLEAWTAAGREAEKNDPLYRNRVTLEGGDADRGRDIVLNNAAVYCQRCHKLDGQGGEVGPALNGVGAKQSREYLLESLVLPSKQIAKGYESVILQLLDGRTVTGVLRGRTPTTVTVVTADNKLLTLAADDIDAERPDKSAMPEDLYKKLSMAEMRDVIEFLASLQQPPAPAGK